MHNRVAAHVSRFGNVREESGAKGVYGQLLSFPVLPLVFHSLSFSEPLTIISSFPTTSEFASLSVSLTCTAEGPESIHWLWRNNTEELSQTADTQFNPSGTSSTLTISNLDVNGGGIIQCVANDDQGGYASANDVFTVKSELLFFAVMQASVHVCSAH